MFAIFSPRSKDMVKEMILISIYYVGYFFYLSYIPSTKLRLIYFLVNNAFTSIVFLQIVLAHLAMPHDDTIVEEEFFKH
jgi:energy-converting hydrogenase Eha subunit E